MRKLVLVAGLAVAAFIPTFAVAQSTCEQQHDNRVVGTIAGAGVGALLGGAIAPRQDRTAGVVIGAVGGGIVGNQLTRPNEDCVHAYGYYTRDNQWHANQVAAGMAQGYYDRDGVWVDGAPNGAYDRDGRWTASDASGHYDQRGRWIAGASNGAYDIDGRWMPGAANGHRDGNGMWITDAQPGYYDNQNHWRRGSVQGHYDDRGVWIFTTITPAAYTPDVGYPSHHDIDSRAIRFERRVQAGANSGVLSRYDASRAIARLGRLRQIEAGVRDDNGQLSAEDNTMLQARMDRLVASVNLPRDAAF
jgi:hypothetical protein